MNLEEYRSVLFVCIAVLKSDKFNYLRQQLPQSKWPCTDSAYCNQIILAKLHTYLDCNLYI